MTVEQLKVIVTAQTGDFQAKIDAVNEALERTVSLAENASAGIIGMDIQTSEKSAQVSPVSDREITPEGVAGARASVLSLRSGETLIGAVNGGNENKGTAVPFQIFTTVELDGERVGQSVESYNASRQRITNGR